MNLCIFLKCDKLTIMDHIDTLCLSTKPRVSLTAPNRDYFEQVSLMVLDFFGCNFQSLKTNLRIYSTESQASFTDKEFFSFGNGI